MVHVLFSLMFFCWILGWVSLHVSSLRVDFCYLQFYSFLWYIFHWFSKSGILGVHFSCVRLRGWCGAQISHSSGKRSVPLWSLLIVDHCDWDVHFFLGEAPYLCLSSQAQCGSFTFCCGNSVHPVILYVVIGMLCLWEEISQDIPILPSYIQFVRDFFIVYIILGILVFKKVWIYSKI